MVKRGRDEQQAHHENPTRSPPQKRCRDLAGGGAVGKARGAVEIKGRQEPDAKRAPLQVAPGDVQEARAMWDAGSAAGELPRWWQLWVGRGGGMVVDCEELLWGWFPFVDEDFSCDGEKVGWLSIWGDGVEAPQQDAPYDDIWQLKHINEVPGRSR